MDRNKGLRIEEDWFKNSLTSPHMTFKVSGRWITIGYLNNVFSHSYRISPNLLRSEAQRRLSNGIQLEIPF